jgi:hypothetical protein
MQPPLFTPLRKASWGAWGKIKDSYAFSHGVDAQRESLLTGFPFSNLIIVLFAQDVNVS